MRIGNLVRDRKTVTVQVGDGTVQVTFRPSGITPEIEDRLRDMIAEQRVGASFVALLSGILVEWDLQDDEGRPYPMDAESLRRLPTVFLYAVAQAVSAEMVPNPPSGGSSAAG